MEAKPAQRFARRVVMAMMALVMLTSVSLGQGSVGGQQTTVGGTGTSGCTTCIGAATNIGGGCTENMCAANCGTAFKCNSCCNSRGIICGRENPSVAGRQTCASDKSSCQTDCGIKF